MRKKLRASEAEFNMFCQNNQLIAIDLQSQNLLASEKEIRDEVRELNKDKKELEGVLVRKLPACFGRPRDARGKNAPVLRNVLGRAGRCGAPATGRNRHHRGWRRSLDGSGGGMRFVGGDRADIRLA